MSFSFAKVKSFASRVKDTVASNVNTIVQNNPGLSRAGATLREGFSEVVSSVKSTSAALGKSIAQTAENISAKVNATVTVTIRGSEVRYIIDNMGRMCFLSIISSVNRLERRYDDSYVLKSPLQLDNQLVERGFFLSSIQGIQLPGMPVYLLLLWA